MELINYSWLVLLIVINNYNLNKGGHLILNDWFELLQALLNLKANSLSVSILIYKLDVHCLPTGEKQLIIWKPLLHANHIQLNTHSSFNIISDMLCPYVLYQQQKYHLTLSSEITSRSCSNTMQSFFVHACTMRIQFLHKIAPTTRKLLSLHTHCAINYRWEY